MANDRELEAIAASSVKDFIIHEAPAWTNAHLESVNRLPDESWRLVIQTGGPYGAIMRTQVDITPLRMTVGPDA